MRLIDADALKSEMITALADAIRNPDNQKVHISVLVLDKIDEAKTVDAMPVVHGKWIPVAKDLFNIRYFKCSVCGCKEKIDGFAYCHCGARMDGEDQG